MAATRTDDSPSAVAVTRASATFPDLTEGESVATLQPRGVGIDRLSISFPVKRWAEPSRWDSHQYRYADGRQTVAATIRPTDSGPEVMVGVQTVNGRPWGKVECNPARLYDPEGCELLPPRLLGAAATVLWAAGRELTEPDCSADEARVTRLDVARDFRGVTSPTLYVDGLAPLRRPYARRSFTYHDPQRANAQTLFVGSKAGGVRLYDQHAAYAHKGAPEGSLRWECEARRDWLARFGVRQAGELDAVAVAELAADRWEWSRMGETVTGPVNAVQVAMAAVASGEVKRSVATRLLGEMLVQSFGYERQTHRATDWRHRELIGRLGLTTGALWSDDLSRQAVGRLDFETGTEFLELTA